MTHRLRPSQYAILIAIMLTASVGDSLLAQAHVPFIGCKSDGQVGPLDAPKGKEEIVNITPASSQRLAYYKAEQGSGVLAPRGWYCFGVYGSNGSSLFVSPTPLNSKDFLSDIWKGFTGPAIQISSIDGGTSGRFEVAIIIAHVFPDHRAFVRRVIAEKIEPAKDFPFGPYPKDKLTYKSNEVVEFLTPPQTEGLGTRSRLLKNNDPIRGMAIIGGPDTDLIQLSMRLPTNMSDLGPIITQQVEQEAAQALK